VKILIPSHSLELTGKVQQVLLLAAQQGFEINHIELGVSPTQYLELVGVTTSRFSTNLFPHLESDTQPLDGTFIYACNDDSKYINSLSTKNVHIGILNDKGYSDSWLHLGIPVYLYGVNSLSTQQSWCHLAWVIVSLALAFPLEDALVLSRAAMNVSRETWPESFQDFPCIEWSPLIKSKAQFKALAKKSLGLYPVVDSVEWVERLLSLGINTVQLRIKNSDDENLEQKIIRAIALGKQHNAQIFINDYWQLAVRHGAFGVHLGQEDILETDLALIADSGLRLGLSTHGYFELLLIHQLSPSYIALGHIFPTTTKQMPSKPQGLVRLGLYQKLLDSMPYGENVGVPSVAIGGIDNSNIDQVLQQGVSSVAVVRAITESTNVSKSIEELQSHLNLKKVSKPEVWDVI